MNRERVRKSRRQTRTANNSRMGQDLFSYLPPEIILNILLRLPDRTIMSCKCVSKAWLNLLVSPEFVNSHHSNSLPGVVALLDRHSELLYNVFEFVDELNPKHHLNRIFEFDLPIKELYSSVNGLFFLSTQSFINHLVLPRDRDLFISNPITHEYIKLPRPPESSSSFRPLVEFFGFGLSRITGQYKLVRNFREWTVEETTVSVAPFKCQVYTIGTGLWRSISSVGLFKYKDNTKGICLNGNLHWVVRDFKGSSSVWISCFDLESELFSAFSPPPCHDDRGQHLTVSSLKDCLCFCDNSADDETVVWLMKEYGNEKSWSKEFVIRKDFAPSHFAPSLFIPIKVFKSGDIFMVAEMSSLFIWFSKKTQSFHTYDLDHYCIRAIPYTPSFLRLKSFAMEDVTTF